MRSWRESEPACVVRALGRQQSAPRGLGAKVAASFFGLALAGCAQQQPQIGTLNSIQIAQAQNAFVLPGPGGPAVTSVLERRYANAVEQQILLGTSSHVSGQNMLRVQLFGPVDATTTGQTSLREGYLPIKNVDAEMRQLFPGIRMTRSPYYVQNRYGPFGYAVGRSASGDTCLYGWQRLTSTGSTQTLIGNKGAIQIRLRYCDAVLPEQQLLQAMYDFTITAYFRTGNWNPYGEPNPPDASLGRSGAPRYPVAGSEVATTLPPRSVARPAARSLSRKATPAVVAPARNEPIGPMVPTPPISSTPSSQPRSGDVRTDNAQPAVTVPPPPCDPASSTCR